MVGGVIVVVVVTAVETAPVVMGVRGLSGTVGAGADVGGAGRLSLSLPLLHAAAIRIKTMRTRRAKFNLQDL